MNDANELTAGERERLAIWQDLTRMYSGPMQQALLKIATHPNDVLLTMPMRELKGIQTRVVSLTTKLQEVANRE